MDVYLIGVHCVVEEIDRRERARGHRRIGVGRTHITLGGIHSFGPCDREMITDGGDRFRSVASLRG
jgi:chloramphenicol 3-O phosphotransferase